MRGRSVEGRAMTILAPGMADAGARSGYHGDSWPLQGAYAMVCEIYRWPEPGRPACPAVGAGRLFFLFGLLFRRGEPLQALEELFLGHALDRDLGIVGIDRGAGRADQRDGRR